MLVAVVIVVIVAGLAVLLWPGAGGSGEPAPDRAGTAVPSPTPEPAKIGSATPQPPPSTGSGAPSAPPQPTAVDPPAGSGAVDLGTPAVLPLEFTQARPQPSVTDQAAFDRMAAAALDALHASPRSVRFELEGHTSGEGTTIFNLWLGTRRAEEVRSLLVARGLPYDRFVVKSKGAASPVATDDTPDAQARNRRVTLRVLGAR